MRKSSTFIIGLGTGRCGTTSLSKILSSQPNMFVSHEFGDIPFNWNSLDGDFERMQKIIYKDSLTGVVAFYLINYIDRFEKLYGKENIRIIILKRNKGKTIKSWLRWSENPNRNFWIDPSVPDPKFVQDGWGISFPNYDPSLPKSQLVSQYYDDYYKLCDEVIKKYDTQSILFEMENLNNEDKLKELLEWCGSKDPIIPKEVRFNRCR
jgi:hypothetical protein